MNDFLFQRINNTLYSCTSKKRNKKKSKGKRGKMKKEYGEDQVEDGTGMKKKRKRRKKKKKYMCMNN